VETGADCGAEPYVQQAAQEEDKAAAEAAVFEEWVAQGENGGWKTKLIISVGGTCGSVNVQTFNDNLKELHVIKSKRNAIRKGLVYELLTLGFPRVVQF
jgi:hypothetical protein